MNPRNTSRLDPWGNQLWRGSDFPTNLLDYLDYQPGADWVAGINGYKAHSGLNAARNIGFKAIIRYKFEAVFGKQQNNVGLQNTADQKAQSGNTSGVQSGL